MSPRNGGSAGIPAAAVGITLMVLFVLALYVFG
jgi:hypothetical protein